MKTRRLLLVSKDNGLITIVKMSALTLTKLNCQVSIEVEDQLSAVMRAAVDSNLDMIIIDADEETLDHSGIIRSIRADSGSEHKKIIVLTSKAVNENEIFSSGCDSIMTREEFNKAVNHILAY